MFITHLLHTIGNQTAVDNARWACRELSRQRVEREEVEIFLDRHRRARGISNDPGTAVAGQ